MKLAYKARKIELLQHQIDELLTQKDDYEQEIMQLQTAQNTWAQSVAEIKTLCANERRKGTRAGGFIKELSKILALQPPPSDPCEDLHISLDNNMETVVAIAVVKSEIPIKHVESSDGNASNDGNEESTGYDSAKGSVSCEKVEVLHESEEDTFELASTYKETI